MLHVSARLTVGVHDYGERFVKPSVKAVVTGQVVKALLRQVLKADSYAVERRTASQLVFHSSK